VSACAASLVAVCGSWSSLAFAQAQPAPEGIRSDPHAYDTPQHFALELRFGLYRPDVDSDPALHGAAPYAASFGPARRAMLGLELDWQALRIPHVGSIGPGLSIATTTATRPAQTQSGQSSSEDMSFTINPLSALAVFRADAFLHDAGVPLVPYAKAGLVYALWSASTSAGTSEIVRSDGSTAKGRGASWGYALAAGLAFDLGVLDERSARGLDQATGINHTYIFGEWTYSAIDGLFQSNAMRLGDSTWNAGLAFEF
jgi:hypothetical protein